MQNKRANLEIISALKSPELLWLDHPASEKRHLGCDQEWYQGSWQRRAGCGPCTAATILYYLAATRPELNNLFSYSEYTYDTIGRYMDELWHYVTPGVRGVNDPAMLQKGVERYAKEHNSPLKAKILSVPARPQQRLAHSSWLEFCQSALAADSPVAFLNLSRGRLRNLDSWHWVTLIGLYRDQNKVYGEIGDSGTSKLVNLSSWYDTSRLGGAFVSFHSPEVT